MPSLVTPREPVVVEKRRYLTPKQKAQLCLDQSGKCALCADKLREGTIEYDHRIPLALGGSQEMDNWDALCTPCHKDKTKLDRWDIAKAERMGGGRGSQTARRERNGSRLQSRGFDRRFTKKMDGTVVPRESDNG